MTVFREAWPSETKIAGLRDQGQVAFAPGATVLAGFIASGLLIFSERTQLVELASPNLDSQPAEHYWLMSSVMLELLLKTGGLFALVFLISGLLQTRFLLRPGLLTIDFSRLSFSAGRLLKPLCFWPIIALLNCLLLALAALLFWWGAELALSALQAFNSLDLLTWMIERALKFLLAATVILGILLVPWVGLSQFLYLYRHRMTREEVERESRS